MDGFLHDRHHSVIDVMIDEMIDEVIDHDVEELLVTLSPKTSSKSSI